MDDMETATAVVPASPGEFERMLDGMLLSPAPAAFFPSTPQQQQQPTSPHATPISTPVRSAGEVYQLWYAAQQELLRNRRAAPTDDRWVGVCWDGEAGNEQQYEYCRMCCDSLASIRPGTWILDSRLDRYSCADCGVERTERAWQLVSYSSCGLYTALPAKATPVVYRRNYHFSLSSIPLFYSRLLQTSALVNASQRILVYLMRFWRKWNNGCAAAKASSRQLQPGTTPAWIVPPCMPRTEG